MPTSNPTPRRLLDSKSLERLVAQDSICEAQVAPSKDATVLRRGSSEADDTSSDADATRRL